jgi:hypothetical protein
MSDQWKARQQEADSPYADAYCYIAATGDRPDQLYSLETLEELASCAERDASIPAYADSPALSAWRHELRSAIERASADRIDPYNGETDKHYRRAGDLRAFCACGERFTEEHLASLTDGWHGERESAEESATDVRAAIGAIVFDGTPADQVRQLVALLGKVTRERDARAELINGCNVEACLRYAQERISALESERDSWRDTAQVLDRELTSANERVERWRSHAKDLEREVNARAELTAQAREIDRAEDRANARARSNARARRSGR